MNDTQRKRLVYFISDRTGITSEGLGEALLTQFDDLEFKKRTYPFVDTVEKATQLLGHIDEEVQQNECGRAIIFSSIVKQDIRNLIKQYSAFQIDFYDTFIHSLENELESTASNHVGQTHGMGNQEKYDKRIEALNFALNHDDGITERELSQSDVILVGVSRCGKTPTCLYLALQFGIKAANYPLTPDDLEKKELPRMLKPYLEKLYGLTIDVERLRNIRNERRPNSHYASLENCEKEISSAKNFFKRHNISYLSSTHKSVEELATAIMQKVGLKRRF